jgi:hypothetical protein
MVVLRAEAATADLRAVRPRVAATADLLREELRPAASVDLLRAVASADLLRRASAHREASLRRAAR